MILNWVFLIFVLIVFRFLEFVISSGKLFYGSGTLWLKKFLRTYELDLVGIIMFLGFDVNRVCLGGFTHVVEPVPEYLLHVGGEGGVDLLPPLGLLQGL